MENSIEIITTIMKKPQSKEALTHTFDMNKVKDFITKEYKITNISTCCDGEDIFITLILQK